jgi:threonine synthase
MIWRGIIHHYRAFLPINDRTPIVTLHEGNTPLIRVENLEKVLDQELEIYLKYEGLNPTGSFKDRGMTVAISKAKEEGARAVICASTGNTSASAAAYAARAGIPAYVLIPKDAIALGKLSQAMMHGATVLAVDGNFDQALHIVRYLGENYPITIVNSINPLRIEGQKTGAFEICEQLGGRAPDYQAIPVGNAGNITAYWQGYKEYKAQNLIPAMPRMIGFQAEGAAPIVRGHVIEDPHTIATAIKIGNPASWKKAENAAKESQGAIDMVSDEEILHAYKLLAREGVFVEPASAASVGGVIKFAQQGKFRKGDVIVCILTGHGLKDPDRAIQTAPQAITVPADEKEVAKYLGF